MQWGDEMDREKVIAQCEWAIKQKSPTIIESKTFYDEVLALLKEQQEKIEELESDKRWDECPDTMGKW